MALAAHHRLYELAWDGDPESSRRFRRILRTLLAIVAILGIAIPLLPTPAPTAVETEIPPQLARIMIEKLKPPVPPKPLAKPRVTPKPAVKEAVRPAPERADLARERAQRSIDKFKDQLADLRQQMADMPEETKNLTGAVGARSHAERSLITARAGEGSAGITSAPMSRGFGGGAGSLHGTDTARVTSSILQSGLNARSPAAGRGGAAGRSAEEIAMVFDRNKGAIYALYERALRTNPMLQGKLVLEFTIAPGGAVTRCRVVSSELHDPALEREIVARVMLFRFPPEKVDPTTATKPIDFFPA
ncbi:MAG TPA: AgmX/PglI C-terminal domain-containing protein [Steroidobacteraceae bacterium]|jgi:TonB family protein|nr:AgmX/PglI C-terminal domain-containing protein [Steroidobacteraceae bacterium]